MENKNLKIYETHLNPPDWAKKEIGAGRLKGKTDINPQWRIECLTSLFGEVGFGWYYTVDKQWIETGCESEMSAFVNISLYVKKDGEWSMPIFGNGGSSFVTKERNGLYQSDECYKMALTDAISVAAKQLGIGAAIYSGSKYIKDLEEREEIAREEQERVLLLEKINTIKCKFENAKTANEFTQIKKTNLDLIKGSEDLQNFAKACFDKLSNTLPFAIDLIQSAETPEKLETVWNKYPQYHHEDSFIEAKKNVKF